MRFEPLGNRIMVVMDVNTEGLSRGGIIIPEAVQDKPQIGNVVAVGPGRIRDDGTSIPNDIRVGDRVLLGKYSGSQVKLDGVSYMILTSDEVLGILR